MNEISMHGFILDQADTEGCIFDAEDTGNELGVSWMQKPPARCQCLDKSYLDADLHENQGGIIWKDHQPTGTGSQDWGHLSPAEEYSGYRRSYQWGSGVYFMLAFIKINLSVGQDTGGPPASCRSRPSDLSHCTSTRRVRFVLSKAREASGKAQWPPGHPRGTSFIQVLHAFLI